MRIILYGTSLFIEGLEESLKGVPGLELVRAGADSGDVLAQVRRLEPAAVVSEVGVLPHELGMALLSEFPGLALVALDRETSGLLVLAGHQARAETATDLVRVITGVGTGG